MKKQKGVASMAIMVVMLIMAIALPITTKLVQQTQENRSKAAGTCKNYCEAGSYKTGTEKCSSGETCAIRSQGDASGCLDVTCCTCNDCPASTTRCSDGKLQTCSFAHTWNEGSICPDGQSCKGNACVKDEIPITTKGCTSNGGSCVYSCPSGGVTIDNTDCVAPPVCCKTTDVVNSNQCGGINSPGATCMSQCIDPLTGSVGVLYPNATNCSGNLSKCCKLPVVPPVDPPVVNPACSGNATQCGGSNLLQTCNSSGAWDKGITCDLGCITIIKGSSAACKCTTSKCSNNIIQSCDNGVLSKGSSCSGNYECKDGKTCVPKVVDQNCVYEDILPKAWNDCVNGKQTMTMKIKSGSPPSCNAVKIIDEQDCDPTKQCTGVLGTGSTLACYIPGVPNPNPNNLPANVSCDNMTTTSPTSTIYTSMPDRKCNVIGAFCCASKPKEPVVNKKFYFYNPTNQICSYVTAFSSITDCNNAKGACFNTPEECSASIKSCVEDKKGKCLTTCTNGTVNNTVSCPSKTSCCVPNNICTGTVGTSDKKCGQGNLLYSCKDGVVDTSKSEVDCNSQGKECKAGGTTCTDPVVLPPVTTCSNTNCVGCGVGNCDSTNGCAWKNNSCSSVCDGVTGTAAKKCVGSLLYTCNNGVVSSTQMCGANGCNGNATPNACYGTPPATTCSRKREGDADCDGDVDFPDDLSIWINEFTRKSTTKKADFNGDDRVDIDDYYPWHATMIK